MHQYLEKLHLNPPSTQWAVQYIFILKYVREIPVEYKGLYGKCKRLSEWGKRENDTGHGHYATSKVQYVSYLCYIDNSSSNLPLIC